MKTKSINLFVLKLLRATFDPTFGNENINDKNESKIKCEIVAKIIEKTIEANHCPGCECG